MNSAYAAGGLPVVHVKAEFRSNPSLRQAFAGGVGKQSKERKDNFSGEGVDGDK